MTMLVIGSSAQVNIWEGTRVKKRVLLTPYIPAKRLAPAKTVIVCPGGSYFWHDTETEGHDVARWLQQNGMSAFVLNYRTAYVPAFVTHYRLVFRGTRYPDAQDDLRQAIRYVKSHADDYAVDTTAIGVMGFSAGGHLVMSAAELFAPADGALCAQALTARTAGRLTNRRQETARPAVAGAPCARRLSPCVSSQLCGRPCRGLS